MILTGGDCLMRKDIVAVDAHAKQMNITAAQKSIPGLAPFRYPAWSPELETFREANFVAALPSWSTRFPALQWWNSCSRFPL
jgi:hypothetical protein